MPERRTEVQTDKIAIVMSLAFHGERCKRLEHMRPPMQDCARTRARDARAPGPQQHAPQQRVSHAAALLRRNVGEGARCDKGVGQHSPGAT